MTVKTAAPDARSQIDGMNFAVIVLDPDLVIREVNPAAENLLGISARRLLGQEVRDALEISEGRIIEKLRDSEGQLIARGIGLRAGERDMVVNLTLSALSSHPGWRVMTLSDTGQGEMMSDGTQGALRGPAILAHEIKNPLAAIRGAAQLLKRKVEEKEAALVKLITDEVDRIANLIDRMQRLGRENPDPVGPVNLHSAIHRALDVVSAAGDKGVNLREEFDPSLPMVSANEDALVQVLINLISNARDACSTSVMPEIVVRTRFVSGLVLNVIRLGRPVKLPIEIQVSDNGPGVDPALRAHIFEPFVTSKKNGQGLGLALVNKLVRDMDGRITHERDEKLGWTHFRVHLPVAK